LDDGSHEDIVDPAELAEARARARLVIRNGTITAALATALFFVAM